MPKAEKVNSGGFPTINGGHPHHNRGGRNYSQKPSSPPPLSSRPAGKISSPFKKSLFGDVFGTRSLGDSRSMNGILYRARVHDTVHRAKEETSKDKGTEKFVATKVGSAQSAVEVIESESDSDNDVHMEMNSRLQLAVTLRNWSVIPENNDFVIREGGVHALVALANLDDPAIKKCVASALYHLSCRQENRLELINLNVVTGVTTVMQQVRSRKIAKLCAMTLCNLSKQPNGEKEMQEGGVVVGLSNLLIFGGQRLLPICVQGWYNLTCAVEPFTGMERIVKYLINVSSTGFDHMYYFVKAVVNCCRFNYLRSRLIEDGALGGLASFVVSLPNRENRDECVLLAATSLRLFSESSACRNEMISKGCLELLQQLLPQCDETGRLLVVITVFNLYQPNLPLHAYESAVTVVTNSVLQARHAMSREIAAACLFYFTRDNNFKTRLNNPTSIINVIPLLLDNSSPLAQYYVIAACGNLFLENSSFHVESIEALIQRFVDVGARVKDPLALQVMSIAIARLSQESFYLQLLGRLGLLLPVLEIMLNLVQARKSDMIVQESACVSICRISVYLQELPLPLPIRVANVMFDLLATNSAQVLTSTISSIRCLGEGGLCHQELLSDAFLARVASIVARHMEDATLVRNCIAVLAVFSYDVRALTGLAAESVMSVLFLTSRVEDRSTREFVATTLCNISVDQEARLSMVERGVVAVLSNLSGSTSELILELCAKCICNLSCSAELHQKIIKNDVLQIILMIALVRSVSNATKLLCARALLNLSTEENIDALKHAGAIRIFATLATINSFPIQTICARGFLIFTGSETRREDIISRKAVLGSVFGLVKSGSLKVRVYIGFAICNLLACTSSQKAAIHAGGLSILKILGTMDIDELTKSTAQVIVSLVMEPGLHPYLIRESLVPVLVLFLQHPSHITFQCALHALSSMAQHEYFHNHLIDKGCAVAVVESVLAGRVNTPRLAEEVCRILTLLSYNYPRSDVMVMNGCLLAPHVIYSNGTCSVNSAGMIALLFRNLSFNSAMNSQLLEHEVLKLSLQLVLDYKQDGAFLLKVIIILMANLSLNEASHEKLMEQGLMQMYTRIMEASRTGVIPRHHHHKHHGHHGHGHHHHHHHVHHGSLAPHRDSIATPSTSRPTDDLSRPASVGDGEATAREPGEDDFERLMLTQSDVFYLARTLNKVAGTTACHLPMVEGSIVRVCEEILEFESFTPSRYEIASALTRLSASKSCRQSLVKQGACELLVDLSKGSSDIETQKQCSLAVGFLSEITAVHNGIVGSLLLLSLQNEELLEMNDAQNRASSPLILAEKPATGILPAVGGGMAAGVASVAGATTPAIANPSSVGRPGGRNSLTSEHIPLPSQPSGHKSFKVMLRDGLYRKKDVHGVLADAAERKRNSVVVDRHEVTVSNGEIEPMKKTHTEGSRLSENYAHCMFKTIVASASPQQGGTAMKFAPDNLSLPSLTSDQTMEPQDRRGEISKLPIASDPLPKELGTLAEYIGGEDSAKDEEERVSNASASRSGSPTRLGTPPTSRAGSEHRRNRITPGSNSDSGPSTARTARGREVLVRKKATAALNRSGSPLEIEGSNEALLSDRSDQLHTSTHLEFQQDRWAKAVGGGGGREGGDTPLGLVRKKATSNKERQEKFAKQTRPMKTQK